MRRIARSVLCTSLAIVVVPLSAWASLAIWYRLPDPAFARALVAGLFALLGLCTIVALFSRWRLQAGLAFAFFFIVTIGWWSTIHPSAYAEWAPDVARQVTGTVTGDMLTLTDVRNFDWRSNTDFTEQWTTRTYDLTKLRTVDVFMSYWSGPQIAHMILSFGFEGGGQLAWSVEVRRRVGGEFSPIADLFKSNPLVIIAADERDVVGVRSNVRGEDVQLYRLKASPEQARALLLEYVADANELASSPRFYNSLTTNCTTTVAKMMRAVGDIVPFDWRLIVNGYLPDYAYDRGALDTRLPLSQLRSLSHIDERAKAIGLSAGFSEAIRAGVPSPG
ncbi:DUF4105 domain-containing protein [Rhizobium sp. 2YAF20]|uniref:Lnb N-terminal periplasmic domain-containing protein n=1 Tax=Rhizobium sp. 2YAF20 TaxID=3233027 RepID=UPI003F98B682